LNGPLKEVYMKKTYTAPTLVESGEALKTTRVSGSEGAEGIHKPDSIGSVGFAL
jgi:hypothetical protein